MNDDLIKECEDNVIKVARAWEDALSITKALSRFGLTMCKEYVGKDKFYKGLRLMQDAIYQEYCHAISQCFVIVGVGDKVKDYSIEKFKETFDENQRTEVMHFLDEYGQTPDNWRGDVGDELREQAKSKIKNIEEGRE